VVDEHQQSPSKGPKKRSANAIGNSRRPIRASRRFKTEKTGDSNVAGYPSGSNESMFITDQSEQPNTMNEAIESDNTIDEPKRAKRTVVRQLLSTGRRLMPTSSHTVVDVTMVNSRCAEIESNMAAVESKMNAMREVALDTEKNREFVELNAQYRLLQMEWSAARKSMSDRSSQLRMAELSRQAPKRRRDRPSTPEPSGYLMTGDEVLSIYQPVNSAGGNAGGGQMAEEEEEVDDSNATTNQEVAPMKARGILRRRGPDQKTAISLRKSLSSYSRTIE